MVETVPTLVEVYCETYMHMDVVVVLLSVVFACSLASALIFSALEHLLFRQKTEN